MNLDLLKKAMGVTEDIEIDVFGERMRKYPVHLGESNPTFEKVWLWEFEDYEVAILDEGNGHCRVLMVETVNRCPKCGQPVLEVKGSRCVDPKCGGAKHGCGAHEM